MAGACCRLLASTGSFHPRRSTRWTREAISTGRKMAIRAGRSISMRTRAYRFRTFGWTIETPITRSFCISGCLPKNISIARIIEASSNPGGIVWTALQGQEFTLVAADMLGRQWVRLITIPKQRAIYGPRFANGTQPMGDFVGKQTPKRKGEMPLFGSLAEPAAADAPHQVRDLASMRNVTQAC